MRKPVGKGQPPLYRLAGLLWVAKKPEVVCHPVKTRASRVKAIDIGQGAMFLRVVQGRPLLQGLIPLGKVSHHAEVEPQSPVRLYQKRSVLDSLGHGKKVSGL